MGRIGAALLIWTLSRGGAEAADHPMSYLTGSGRMADEISSLLWGHIIVSIVVVVIISALVIYGIARRATRDPLQEVELSDAHASQWIGWGVGISTLVLVGLVVWTSRTMARIAYPPAAPALTIQIFGHQWWWEAVYQSDTPHQIFSTANEIHIPTGRPVRFELKTGDVIHSFWVPSLGGKTDIIPGQTNITWLEADKPGVYRGQCGEFCGNEHARMALAIYADAPDAFERWREAQVSPSATPASDEAHYGRDAFVRRCGVCHTVRGTLAGGHLGPDLTHIMSRKTIAAGQLPNNPGYLSGWIANPQRIKPGALMPNLDLSGPELASIRAFLLTLN